LIEPLRALAKEKYEYLINCKKELEKIFEREMGVKISTGDYRVEDELFSDPPPGGELLIATPERIEAILRNPEYAPWFEHLGAVCIDEAHLLSQRKRGLTLEFLITSLLSLSQPPRLILLSATLSNLEMLQQWLAPCEIIQETQRTPPLHKWVWKVANQKEADAIIVDWLQEEIIPKVEQSLIFVYRTADAEKLSATINDQLKSNVAAAYHSQMSSASREQVRSAFISNKIKVVVSTTALGMGVNLPCRHVVVRDLTFEGNKPLSISDLLQMMGRAGRGDLDGTAIAVVKEHDAWELNELVIQLSSEVIPEFIPASKAIIQQQDAKEQIASLVLAYLSRVAGEGKSMNELREFFAKSLGGVELSDQIPETIHWLEKHKLAFSNEVQKLQLTNLGSKCTKATFPPRIAGGIAQLIRDILSVGVDDEHLARWTQMDNLFLLLVLSDYRNIDVRFGEAKANKVNAWFESHPEQVSVLYRNWIKGQKGFSKAHEVMGSLGDPVAIGSTAEEASRKKAYLNYYKAIILYELAEGKLPKDIEREYEVKNVEGVQEKWRDDMIWLLSGLSKIYSVPNFYYHLKESCKASKERVERVEKYFKKMELMTYNSIESLKYCHPLGSLLIGIKRITNNTGSGIGISTMDKLLENGIFSYSQLRTKSENELIKMGIRKPQARIISKYIRKRSVA
jgi:helicase